MKRIYSYATGGPLSLRADRPAVEALTDGFKQVGYRLPDLLRMVVLNDAFSEVVEDTRPAAATLTASAEK